MIVAGASVKLYDESNATIWSGLTDAYGRARFNLTYTDYNYTATSRLEAIKGGYFATKNVRLLSNTPIIITPAMYVMRILPNEWIDGGAPMGWHADDQSWLYTLPFPFTYFGATYTQIYISSNGLITFAGPDSSFGSSRSGLEARLAIAPAWDDWTTHGVHAGDDIYIGQPSPNCLMIRWQVTAYYDYNTVANFEAILYADGSIRFNYGYSSGLVSATIGIPDGEGFSIIEDLDNLCFIGSRLFTYATYLRVWTDKSLYTWGEAVNISAAFTYLGEPVENATVLFQVTDPSNAAYFAFAGTTDTEGVASVQCPIYQGDAFGNYTVHTSAASTNSFALSSRNRRCKPRRKVNIV